MQVSLPRSSLDFPTTTTLTLFTDNFSICLQILSLIQKHIHYFIKMQTSLLTTVLALAAPLVSAATLPRDVVDVEVRDTTVPGKSFLGLRK